MQRRFKAHEIILREGQPDPGFWVLESGVLQVIKGDKFITEIDEPGAIFGEMSDILHEPCVTTVRAKTDCEVIYIDKTIDSLISDLPHIAKKVLYTLVRRLFNTTNKLYNLLPDSDTISLDHELEILVVDDRPSMVRAIQSSLTHRPWRITSAENTGIATEMTDAHEYALIILSLNLEKQDSALDFYRYLRKNPKTRRIPILATVAPTSTVIRQRAVDIGIEFFLPKQSTSREIETTILRTMGFDPSTVYFSFPDQVLQALFPLDFSDFDQKEIFATAPNAIENAAANRITKALIDAHHLITPHISWKTTIEKLIAQFSKANMQTAVFGNPDIVDMLGTGGENESYTVHNSYQEALESLIDPD